MAVDGQGFLVLSPARADNVRVFASHVYRPYIALTE